MILTSTSCVTMILSMLRRKWGQKTGKAATMVARLISRIDSPMDVLPYQLGSNSGDVVARFEMTTAKRITEHKVALF